MKSNIFLALFEKQAIGSDNIVTAEYTVTDMFGRTFSKMTNFKIKSVFKNANNIVFDLLALDENKTLQTGPDSILYIDGMDLVRYADIYDLLPDGSTKKVGKKRGRKPKNYVEF